MDLVQIGKFIAQLRKEHGFSQEKLGEMLGVTNKTISRWETGTYLPPAEMLVSMSNLFLRCFFCFVIPCYCHCDSFRYDTMNAWKNKKVQ